MRSISKLIWYQWFLAYMCLLHLYRLYVPSPKPRSLAVMTLPSCMFVRILGTPRGRGHAIRFDRSLAVANARHGMAFHNCSIEMRRVLSPAPKLPPDCQKENRTPYMHAWHALVYCIWPDKRQTFLIKVTWTQLTNQEIETNSDDIYSLFGRCLVLMPDQSPYMQLWSLWVFVLELKL